MLKPSALILLAVNLVPLIGVTAWGWDAFVLLMLYWLETAVIAFWTIVRIGLMTPETLGDMKLGGKEGTSSPVGMAVFFTFHAGIFMGVHMLFLWSLFAGSWANRIHSVDGFIAQMVIGTGLWMPLAVLFAGRGAVTGFDLLQPVLRRRFGLREAKPSASPGPGERLVFDLYLRITIMQVTIILGAWFALAAGTAGALAFLILVKTAVDLGFQLLIDKFRSALAESGATSPRQ